MKNLLLLLFLIFVTSSCAFKMPATTPIFELNKGKCRGTCPVFTLKVYENGFVSFEGKQHVDLIGSFKGKLEKEELAALIDKFQRSQFFKYKDEYKAMVMDLPTTQIAFRDGSRSKKITDYYGAPKELKLLEKELEKVISKSKLKPTADAASQIK